MLLLPIESRFQGAMTQDEFQMPVAAKNTTCNPLLPIASRCQPASAQVGYPEPVSPMARTPLPKTPIPFSTPRCQLKFAQDGLPEPMTPTAKSPMPKTLKPLASRMSSISEKADDAAGADCAVRFGIPNPPLAGFQSYSSCATYQTPLMYTPDKKYRIGSTLGEGAHGTVHLSTEVATGDKVAIKIVLVQNIKEAAVECATQGMMNHPNIVPVQETIIDLDGRRIFLIMELCRGGDFFDLIAEVGRLDETSAGSYFRQMASALAECHASGVYHRDLKPENILLDEGGNIKIADFGLALMAGKDTQSSHMSHEFCGSMPYVAPEVFTCTARTEYSAAKADVWSLGIVLFIMLTGKQPFNRASAKNCNAYASFFKQGLSSLGSAKGLSLEAAELLEGMLEPNPKLRLSMSEALASAWLSGTQCLVRNVPKWCEELGYEDRSKKDAAKISSRESQVSETCASTSYPLNSPQNSCESKVPSKIALVEKSASTRYPSDSVSMGSSSSLMRDGETANAMLVRTLGWVQLPAPKERFFEQVLGALEGLGVEYSVAQGEWSHVVNVHIPADTDDADASLCDSPHSRHSSIDTFPAQSRHSPDEMASEGRTHMAGQLTVQLEIVAPCSSKTDVHVTRQKGHVLRFHSFYHDLRNQLAGPTGWDEKAGRYSRIPEAPSS